MLRTTRDLLDSLRKALIPSDYILNIDNAEPSQIKGWAKRGRGRKPVSLRVTIDGRIVADSLLSNDYREDLAKGGVGDGRYGFVVQIPTDLPYRHEYELSFSDCANERIIWQSRISLHVPRANIEARDGHFLIGWAHGTDRIDIFADQAPLAQNIAPNIMREDVAKRFGGTTLCGFKIDVSQAYFAPGAILTVKRSLDQEVIVSKPFDSVPLIAYGNQAQMQVTARAKASLPRYYSDMKEHLKFFDDTFYLLRNPDVAKSGMLPFKHFMDYGWKECRNPSPDFDLIWYTQTYLDSDWSVNPLHYHATLGQQAGNDTRPRQPVSFHPPKRYRTKSRKPRRICLFAGYDAQGIMDPTAIELIREMARHADVYYFADCHMPPSELGKIAEFTKGAWAARHGRYDFGSWSKLASEMVGWEAIETYDELILTNDSSYLMRPLDHVFKTMGTRACDWWGLQAAKGINSTLAAQGLKKEISLDEIKSSHLSTFESDPVYDFLVGSYFLVFRSPVIQDRGFRAMLNRIQEERTKLLVIRKYEIGTTRYLISKGYEFDAFVPTVFPEQAIYTDRAFDLIRNGFPFLKRYHLIENHYKIQDLWRWSERLADAGITKDLSPYRDNLRRVANAQKLAASLDILAPGLRKGETAERLAEIDFITPKYDDWWCFPVCAYSHLFNDNIRALFEHVKNDVSIKKIVLTRSKNVEIDGNNVVILPLDSAEGQFYLTRSRNIFLKHTVKSNLGGATLSPKLHNFYNLWHGIPLKRIGYASRDQQGRLAALEEQNRLLRSVICASKVDQLAMATAYWPLTINDVWLTGLPRHDLITKDESLLPADMRAQLDQLRVSLRGRKLILFAPTFKNDQAGGYYSFSETEIAQLTQFLTSNGFVLGVREHMADKSRQYSSQLSGDCYISTSEASYPTVEILMREAFTLITDYSSIFIDFLITGRQVISFAYDYDRYVNEERGLFYDLDWCFPGTIAKNFGMLMDALQQVVVGMDPTAADRYVHRRHLFIEHFDNGNSARVLDRVKQHAAKDRTLLDIENRSFEPRGTKKALWITEDGYPGATVHRVLNLCSQLSREGWSNKIVSKEELVFSDLVSSSVVVFSCVSADDRIIDMVEAVRRSGCSVIADIDDLVFEPELLADTAQYNGLPADRPNLRQAAYGLRRLLEVSSCVTVSTETMRAHVTALGFAAHVLPYAISCGNLATERTGLLADRVRVCYLAEPQSHSDDFSLIAQVAGQIKAAHPNAEFYLIGTNGSIPSEDNLRLSGWEHHAEMGRVQLNGFLRTVDIMLAPRAASSLNDLRSELPFVEAGSLGIPTVASPSPSFARYIRDGENGILVGAPEDWVIAIQRLISNPEFRRRLGENARRSVEEHHSADIATMLFTKLCGTLKKSSAPRAQRSQTINTQGYRRA